MTQATARCLNIGITCYPTVGGSGVLACALGEELAARGHDVHFISYERPFRLPHDLPRLHFHPVEVNGYDLFKYPDYTLPLSVKMAEVSQAAKLDVLHVHYAVPHATAAILARSMLPPGQRPAVVTTLHGTDTTLLARDPGYGPAIRYALESSDAVTAVSQFLANETYRLLDIEKPIDVIHNFFAPRPVQRSIEETRRELGVRSDEFLLLHSSNLRALKRIDLLLETVARLRPRAGFKLLILAGATFTPFLPELRRLGLEDVVIVRDQVSAIENYLQAADLGLFTSESESFCLSILEAMWFGCPSVSTRVGGIPELLDDGVTGRLVDGAGPDQLAQAVMSLLQNVGERKAMGRAGQVRALSLFSAAAIVPRYEAVYRRLVR